MPIGDWAITIAYFVTSIWKYGGNDLLKIKIFFLTLLLLLEAGIVGKGSTQSLEVKFWPQDKVYSYTVAAPWLRDIVLQNIAIINRSDKPVALDQMQISVLRNGRITQDRFLSLSQLEPNLQSFYSKYKSGALNIWEQEYQLKNLFQGATLVGTARLLPNEGVSIRDQYLAFNDQADALRVGEFPGPSAKARVAAAVCEHQ